MPGKNFNLRPKQSHLSKKRSAITIFWSVTLADMLPSNAMQDIFITVVMSTLAVAPSLHAQAKISNSFLPNDYWFNPIKRRQLQSKLTQVSNYHLMPSSIPVCRLQQHLPRVTESANRPPGPCP